MFPEKLETFHAEKHQRFHLVKMLQRPPERSGRYLAAGVYVHLARVFGWPLNHLTSVLVRMNGEPYRIWRVGVDLEEDEPASSWQLMRKHNYLAIGWPMVGDLSQIITRPRSHSKAGIAELLSQQYQLSHAEASRKATEIQNFASAMADGEPVLVASGERILGLGRISGSYEFNPQMDASAPHQRRVVWHSTEEFRLPLQEEPQKTVHEFRKSFDNRIEVERRLLDPPMLSTQVSHRPVPIGQLEGVLGRIQSILGRKGQVILYGPPGTGKTYWARRAGLDLAALGACGKRFGQLDASGREESRGQRWPRWLVSDVYISSCIRL